uniref:Uncharacterized protein n=1 Tax=Myripristis murdjan TaxID=586833 RepID=A0A668AM82_9TELE
MAHTAEVIPSCLLVILLMAVWPACYGGKVLVFPMEGSHWVNMDIFIQALHSQGHSVTVIRTCKSWYIKKESPYFDSITISVTGGTHEEFVKPLLNNFIDIERGNISVKKILNLQAELVSATYKISKLTCDFARNMLSDEEFLSTIKNRQYDLVLTDPATGAGILLAHYLKIPLVYNVRWVISIEGHLTIAPTPLSYIPMTGSGLSGKMTFIQRVKNMMFYLLLQFQTTYLEMLYQDVCDEYFEPGVNFHDLIQGADLWLMRVDFVFEFPRPTMPNVIYMGGFQCKPAKPLPQHLEDFKVIWRHKGVSPETLGNNTLLVDWILTVDVDRSLDQAFITELIYRIIELERGHSSTAVFFHVAFGLFDKFADAHRTVSELISKMLDNQELMQTIKDSNYDMVITDPCWGAGTILAKYLNLPLVYNVRWLVVGEGHFSIAPSPVSYIPITGSGYTDKMTFVERVKNMVLYGITKAQYIILVSQIYQKICDKYLGPDNNFHHLVQGADLWLMRVDFVFEFPRPTMPNFIYMGGFQCKPAKPLPQHLEDFVIWRYKGDRPASLGNNTLLVDWMPQNDLLGHPKTKLFVAHGGTNGVQEAIYHGVPVVGLPVFFDQYDNLLRLKERGAAKILTLATVDKDNSFLKALQEVLHEPSYRMNMQRLSRLHRDQPIKPLDLALFWIEFVMRHKGAAHLRTESYKMPWYSYHSVDVIVFLAGVVLLILGTFAAVIKCLCSRLCLRTKVKRE